MTFNGVMAILWCFPPKAVCFRANNVILDETTRPILSVTKSHLANALDQKVVRTASLNSRLSLTTIEETINVITPKRW